MNKPRRSRRVWAAAALALMVMLNTACESDDGTTIELARGLNAYKHRLSVLQFNLVGTTETWNRKQVPWRERYDRAAQWMAQAPENYPDIIGLNEVWYLNDALHSATYEPLLEFVSKVNARTNERYRIAFASSVPGPNGTAPGGLAAPLWAGQAVVYNANRLTNTTYKSLRLSETEQVYRWDDQNVIGVHLRESHPCGGPWMRPDQVGLCQLVDPTPYVGTAFTNYKRRFAIENTAASFELRDANDVEILVHNLHTNLDPQVNLAERVAVRTLLDATKRRFQGHAQVYPPMVVADFNVCPNDMRDYELVPGGLFEDFEIASLVDKVDTKDVVGVLIGKPSLHPSKFTPFLARAQVLPGEYPHGCSGQETGTRENCGDSDVLWSDHCAVYVRFVPAE